MSVCVDGNGFTVLREWRENKCICNVCDSADT